MPALHQDTTLDGRGGDTGTLSSGAGVFLTGGGLAVLKQLHVDAAEEGARMKQH